MSLPAFYSRIADALRPIAEIQPEVLRAKLEQVTVELEYRSADETARVAYQLAANLCARLYPRIRLIAPAPIAEQAQATILAINPDAELTLVPTAADRAGESDDLVEATATVVIGPPGGRGEPSQVEDSPHQIHVTARGWTAEVDSPPPPAENQVAGHPLAWLAAAAIGVGEVFRAVFAVELGQRGRTAPQPGRFNLITLEPTDSDAPVVGGRSDKSRSVALGHAHLVGAGAIGQAFLYALNEINVEGTLHVVDPETITLSNLQRYLLTNAGSVNRAKASVAEESLKGSRLKIEPFQGRWGDAPEHLQIDTAVVALDSAQDRIAVAASLPKNVYNAWTQIADLGWSRHEAFGVEPCLACLYYPDRQRPSEHELIAEALKQPPLRVLAYLVFNLPIGFALPTIPAVPDYPIEPGNERWTDVSLAADLVASGIINESELVVWNGHTIGALYRDGICAGGLIPVGDLASEVLVPLAHQSALAGIMLATELVVARDQELREFRTSAVEGRYDVLRGFPQVMARPRARTDHCFCSDPVYLRVS